ncbi:MAG: M48 family metallopeptidase [Rhodoferax sp.]|uniref:M48 family metallopeptidase n=1 Tax=Rhodoferax sp. TaxID=50421 RepID=UPI0014003CAB|nr:M48 family metallopeptidase [Rhodoferax sp.]NDP37367.1 M48 family metallopeptidase [Rhodoferax sp.]
MNSLASCAPAQRLKFLQGYPADTLAQVAQLIADQRLGQWLQNKYPDAHGVRTDKALFEYVQALKANYLRGAEPLAKVAFDSKLQIVQHALGTHTTVSRVQGNKLKAKREIRIAALFKDAPPEFLTMISVHELAHLKERAHDKAFYQLCCHMEPRYHQLEFELRVYLTHLDASGPRLWGLQAEPRPASSA